MTENNTHLTCGHMALFEPPPFRGDCVWCYRCSDYRTVSGGKYLRSQKDIIPRPNVKVLCENCSFNRGAPNVHNGQDVADTHSLKTGHRVLVQNRDGDLLVICTPEGITRAASVTEP